MAKDKPLYINVDASLFRAAAICQSDETEVRGYLCGVYVTRHPQGGAVLVATDGHRMVVIRDHSGEVSKPAIIGLPRDGLRTCAAKEGESRRLRVDQTGNGEVVGLWQSPKPVVIDATFPDWRRCVPVQEWKNTPVTFNRDYLSSFAKVAGAVDPNHTAIRILTGSAPNTPALILFPYFLDAFGILMPMYSPEPLGLPVWMKPIMPKPARAVEPPKARVKGKKPKLKAKPAKKVRRS